MTRDEILSLINSIKSGAIGDEEVVKQLANFPFNDIGCAKIDTARAVRNGVGEVIFGLNKTDDEVVKIAAAIGERKQNTLITRTNGAVFTRLGEIFNSYENERPTIEFNERGRTISIKFSKPPLTQSYIAIVSAGTADGTVVEEAYETAKFLGNDVRKITDVGVAGIHRLFLKLDEIQNAKVVIAVAGMEGALPSVVAGLVKAPVIAVPTSVGYGASFGGVAALLAMLNSCANGISVVNIDNGYGAAYNASLINHI